MKHSQNNLNKSESPDSRKAEMATSSSTTGSNLSTTTTTTTGHRLHSNRSSRTNIRFQPWLLVSASLALALLIAATPTASAASYFFAPSNPSSLSSSSASNAGNPVLDSYARAGQLVLQQQPNKAPVVLVGGKGQKEAEQPMNPNEVGSASGERVLEPLAAEVAELEDLEGGAYDDFEKRAKWNSLQGGWGKRAPNNWNKLSAAWGKRRLPNTAGGSNSWNNLSGMWGKKRAKWNELSGMWGKRAWKDMQAGWGKKKRSGSSPHWNKLRGMWGKRSAV